ncbi:MAG: Tricarboxylate transport protein TctC [Betaproteobacteria bacterium]|nr:Tricarboxylate transport protein TctC [Betaproteobacteria bacterium]
MAVSNYACAALLVSGGCALSAAAEYPDRPIRYIVPSAAGGGADISARLLTSELATQLKQQFVIDNRPSSAGLIGVQLLAKSRADGYTLGYGNMTYLAINPSLVPDLPYDADRDLQPIGQFTSGQNLLAVRNTLPVKSVQELIAHARANPDKLSFVSSGNGTTLHLSGELFKQMTGTRMVHVPYKAVGQGLTDLMGGQVDVIFDNQSSIAPHVSSGRVRALAVTGPSRSAVFPDLPTMNEAGVRGYVITTWTGMMGPAGLPRPIVNKLNAEIQRACAVPKVQAVLATQGAVCATGSPEQFVQFVKSERVKWGEIVRRSGAKVD